MGNVSFVPEPESWMDAAACVGEPEVIFFPMRGDSPEPAQQICGVCAVRADCLEFALAHNERFGIWGGLTERERRRLRRERATITLTVV